MSDLFTPLWKIHFRKYYRYKITLKNIKTNRLVRYNNVVSYRFDEIQTKSIVLNFTNHRRYYQMNEWRIVYLETRKIFEEI